MTAFARLPTYERRANERQNAHMTHATGSNAPFATELRVEQHASWAQLLADSPDASIYHQPEYLRVLCECAGGRFRIVGVCQADELVGGVALYERDSRFGTFAGTRLLLYYNGLVLRRYDTKYPSQQTSRDVATETALALKLESMGYGSISLRSVGSVSDVRAFLARGWQASLSYSYVVALDDLAAQWERVEQNLRRLIKRCASRDRLVVTEDVDFGAFYRLHAITLGRRGVNAYLPERAFRRYFTALHSAGLARLFHARLPDGRSIAAQLVLLGPNRTSQTVSAAGDPEFLRLGAHAFLRWNVFERLASLGYHSNDLTDATLNPVTHFKSQLGGRLTASVVLQSPQTRLFAIGQNATRWRQALRRRASAAARRLAGRAPA